MNKSEEHIIQSLLEKHALGICTPEERTVLQDWYEAFPENGTAFTDQAEKNIFKAGMKASIMEAIQPAVETPRPGKMKRIYWQVAAAAAVLFLVFTFVVMYKPAKEINFTTVTAPKGKGVMKLHLPDQSTVWLQAGSVLRYNGRNIELIDGSAGFSVTGNSNDPFVVSTISGLQVKVLGTSFMVTAFRELPDIKVYVESGAVQVTHNNTDNMTVLGASERLVYNTGTHTFKQDSVDVASYDHWKEGEYSLDNSSFAELARVLKDHFDAEIRYDDRMMSSYRFNLKITRHSTLAEVFDMLKEISGVDYTINGNQVTITGVHQ